METQSELSELELDDVVITNPHIEAILDNEDWIEDASYVWTAASWHGVKFRVLEVELTSIDVTVVFQSALWILILWHFLQQWSGLSLHLHPEGNGSSSLLSF